MLRSALVCACLVVGFLNVREAVAQTSTKGTVISQLRVTGGGGAILVKSVRTFAGPVRLFADFLDRSGNTIRRDVELGSPQVAGNQTRPCAAALVNGGYAIAWRNDHQSAYGGVRYSIVTNQGASVAKDLKANIRYSTSLRPNVVIAISNGGFLIAWSDTAQGTNWHRYFNSLGTSTSGEIRD